MPFGAKKSVAKAEVPGVPTLAAGTFKLRFLPKHFFAYAVMNRQLSDLSMSFKDEVTKEVFTTLPGDESFSAESPSSLIMRRNWKAAVTNSDGYSVK